MQYVFITILNVCILLNTTDNGHFNICVIVKLFPENAGPETPFQKRMESAIISQLSGLFSLCYLMCL